jgi:hypothetical protein
MPVDYFCYDDQQYEVRKLHHPVIYAILVKASSNPKLTSNGKLQTDCRTSSIYVAIILHIQENVATKLEGSCHMRY